MSTDILHTKMIVLLVIDECIEFVEENPHFRDYEEYSVKFHQLYIRGLSILRNHICENIRKAVDRAKAGVSLNAHSKLGLEGTTQYSLLYIRFQVLGEHHRRLHLSVDLQ